MRRAPKPFTVEIRSSGRKPKLQVGSTWPQLDDQPDVTWPQLVDDPYRDPRQPPPVPQQPAEEVLPKPTGRILPVIAEQELAVPSRPAAPARKTPTRRPKPVAVAVDTQVTVPVPSASKVAPAPTAQPRIRTRPARQDFKRGERWQARLSVWARKRIVGKLTPQS